MHTRVPALGLYFKQVTVSTRDVCLLHIKKREREGKKENVLKLKGLKGSNVMHNKNQFQREVEGSNVIG